jgi:hypothetical protein
MGARRIRLGDTRWWLEKLADRLPASPASQPSQTLFLLWQFLTSAHDDVVLLHDIANRPTGEFNGHKDFSSAERHI